MQQQIIISNDIEHDLATAVAESEHDRVFVLTDDTTHECRLPKVAALLAQYDAVPITIAHGDQHKTLAALGDVWTALQQGGATRHSLLINLGGGMITDLGGFAAATFNFGGLKNEIGAFADARFVIINTSFLDTLDAENLCSGYAEMLKHALISDERMWAEHVNFDLSQPDLAELQRMVAESIAVKERIVAEDPHEHGIRKALNFGHTIGHALEEFALQQAGGAVVSTAPINQTTGGAVVSTAPNNQLTPKNRPLLHGYAVAFGLIGELYMSARKAGFPTERLHQTTRFIRENYAQTEFTCNDYPTLLDLMRHDKKNTSGVINFTLLHNIGDIRINQTATDEEICEALDFIREGY